MRFSWALTGLTHSCAVLSVVLRAVRDCGLLGCLSFGMYNNSWQQFSNFIPSGYPASKTYSDLFMSEISLECLLCIRHRVERWGCNTDMVYLLKGFKVWGEGKVDSCPHKHRAARWVLQWEAAWDVEEVDRRRHLSHAQSNPGKDFWMKQLLGQILKALKK